MRFAFSIVLILGLFSTDYAQTCCSGGVPMSNNIGLPVAAKGTWQFALNYDWNVLKTLRTEQKLLNDNRSERITKSILFELGYVIGNRLSTDVFFSYVKQERNINSSFGINSSITEGLGDAVILLKYKIFDRSGYNWVVGIGPKFPLGKSNLKDELGLRHNADMQPGSGAWDAIIWTTSRMQMNFRKSMGTTLNFSFRSTGENKDYLGSIAYEFGDEYQFVLGLSDRFALGSFLLDPSISIRYRKAFRDVNNRQKIEPTGGKWMFINPGISFTVLPNLAVNGSLEMPIYSFVNGTQLTPTYRFNVGAFYKLSKKEKL